MQTEVLRVNFRMIKYLFSEVHPFCFFIYNILLCSFIIQKELCCFLTSKNLIYICTIIYNNVFLHTHTLDVQYKPKI